MIVCILKETTESVTFRMLDNVVALEVIQTRLTQQIRPYMKEHHLKEDVVFTKYVKVLSLFSSGYFMVMQFFIRCLIILFLKSFFVRLCILTYLLILIYKKPCLFTQDLLERSMGLTSFYGEAPWEAKVIAVIGCIKDPRVRCQCRVNLNG